MGSQEQPPLTQDATQEFDAIPEPVDQVKPWGRAVSTNPIYPTVPLIAPDIVFGRRSACGVQLQHPAISGEHCRVSREEDHLVFLHDLSTNGTFIKNKTGTLAKVGKNKKMLISSGAEIVLIRTADETISYLVYLDDEQDNKGQDLGIENVYDIRNTLGTGAFATVKLCINKSTGQKYAVKIIDKKKFALNHGTSRSDALMDEVKILKTLTHQHIIKIYDTYESEQHLYLILELVTGGDLFDQIVVQGSGYSEPRARNIFTQMLAAISYLHAHNIVHRDLKPENILLARKGEDVIKISDFGLSRVIGEGSFMKTLCGTPQYLAPEVLGAQSEPTPSQPDASGYDKSVDLWSLGVILYILLSGSPPFDDSKNLLDQVKNGRYSFPKKIFKNVSPSAIDLVKKLLCVDPSHRITVPQVESHPWFLGQSEPAVAEEKEEIKQKSGRGRGRPRGRGRGGATSSKQENSNVGVKRKNLHTTGNGSNSTSTSAAKKMKVGSNNNKMVSKNSEIEGDENLKISIDERADTPPIEKTGSDEKITSLDSDEEREKNQNNKNGSSGGGGARSVGGSGGVRSGGGSGLKLQAGLITSNNLADYPKNGNSSGSSLSTISEEKTTTTTRSQRKTRGIEEPSSSDPLSRTKNNNNKNNQKEKENSNNKKNGPDLLKKPVSKKRRVRTR